MSYKFISAISTLILFVLFIQSGYGQDHHDHKHDEAIHKHKHNNEFSVAVGVVPLPEEDKTTLGIHLHYIRGIGTKNRFGIGIGLETIFDEHKHYTISSVFQYRIHKGLILSYAPGLLILVEESENELQFAQHIEMTYEFEVGEFHIGPVVELGIEKEGVHYMGGIHFGIDF